MYNSSFAMEVSIDCQIEPGIPQGIVSWARKRPRRSFLGTKRPGSKGKRAEGKRARWIFRCEGGGPWRREILPEKEGAWGMEETKGRAELSEEEQGARPRGIFFP